MDKASIATNDNEEWTDEEEAVKDTPKPAAEDKKDSKLLNEIISTMHNVNIQLADQQANKDSPLYSAKTFEELGLSQSLLKGLYAMKFVKPSKVQEKALPLLLSNPPTNMIAQSQSGTGKTAAFVLTMLSRIDTSQKTTQALCLAPTRELARQIMDVVEQMGQFTSVTTFMAVPGAVRERVDAHIVIGTPGTMVEMGQKRLVDGRNVKVFCLDEADVMLERQGLGHSLCG